MDIDVEAGEADNDEKWEEGNIYKNSVTGNTIRFINIPRDPTGNLVYETTIAEGFKKIPIELRKRPKQEQSLRVLDGHLRGVITDQFHKPEKYSSFRDRDEKGTHDVFSPLQIPEGRSVDIERGVDQYFQNGSTESETRILVRLSPPLDTVRFLKQGYEDANQRLKRLGTDSIDVATPPTPSLLGSVKRYLNQNILLPLVLVGIYILLVVPVFNGVVDVLGIGHHVEHRTSISIAHFAYVSIISLFSIPVFGYLAQISRSVLLDTEALPTLQEWPNLLRAGAKISVVFLICLFYPAIAGIAIFGFGGALLSTLLGPLGVMYLFPAAYMKVIETDQIRSIVDFNSLRAALLRKSYFVAQLKVLGMLVTALALSGILLLFFEGRYIELLLLSSIFFLLVVTSDYFARIWTLIWIEEYLNPRSGPVLTHLLDYVRSRRSASEDADLTSMRERRSEQNVLATTNMDVAPAERLSQLDRLQRKRLITDPEYTNRTREIVSNHMSTDSTTETSPGEILRKLHAEDLLTDDELERKRKRISTTIDHDRTESSTTEQQVDKITLLVQLYEIGLLTEAEFESKRATIEGESERSRER